MKVNIKATADAGFERDLFSGNRAGPDDQKGLENCEAGLKRPMALAEKHKVTICMELLNSKGEPQAIISATIPSGEWNS